MVTDLGMQKPLLPLVHRLDRIEEFSDITDVAGGTCQRLDVLGKAGTAVSGPRINKLITDPRIRAYPEIANSKSSQELRIVNVAAIENHRIGQRVADALEIRTSEFMPLGYDCQRVGTIERILGAVAKSEVVPVAIEAPCLVHRHRIVGTYAGPVLP